MPGRCKSVSCLTVLVRPMVPFTENYSKYSGADAPRPELNDGALHFKLRGLLDVSFHNDRGANEETTLKSTIGPSEEYGVWPRGVPWNGPFNSSLVEFRARRHRSCPRSPKANALNVRLGVGVAFRHSPSSNKGDKKVPQR